jgi:hypothetical protein
MPKLIRLSWVNFAALPAIGAFFIGGIFLFEWLRIGIIADPNEISKYYFGSEAMMDHGGWRYSSASIYAWSAFAEGMFLIIFSTFTFWSSIQSKGKKTAIGCALIFLWFVISQLSLTVSGIIIGLTICVFTSPLVQWAINKAIGKVELIPPDGITKDDWDKVTDDKKVEEPGKWLGTFERILIFFAVWIQKYEIIAGWFAFKVASKWEVWSNIVKVPESLPESKDNKSMLSYLRARRAWGARILSRFLIGTITNILIGSIVAYVIKYILKYLN